MMSKEELLEQARKWVPEARDKTNNWRKEAKRNYAFYAGHQYTEAEISELQELLRPTIVFNRIQPMVSVVKGQQINNRQSIQYFPREEGDAEVSELLTGASQWVDDECDAEDEITESFEDLLICGMGWSDSYLSYDEDIDGKIHSAERMDPLEMYWDHAAKRQGLKDSKWRAQARWVGRKEAELRWPGVKDLDTDGEGIPWLDEGSDAEVHDSTDPGYEGDTTGDWYDSHKDELMVLRIQWWEHKPVWRMGDPNSKRVIELDEERYNKLKPIIKKMGIKSIRQLRKRYFQAFIIGPEVFDAKPNICPDRFTMNVITGKRDNKDKVWFGLVRGMVDPARWSNKFYADIQDIMVSNRQGGAFVEASALQDPGKAEDTWNDPNPLIMLNDGALARGAIQERNPIPYPQGLDRMMEWAVQALPATSGINMEFMGQTDRDQANVLEVQRKKSALSVLADLFDSMRRFQKERGRTVLYLIQTYISDGRLVRIVGEEGLAQYVPLAKDEQATQYDIIVDESPSSPNQKQETFAVLMQLLPVLMKMGLTPPPEMMDYLPLPASFIAKWKDAANPKQGQPPSPQEQMQEQAATKQIEKLDSEIQKNKAQAEESMRKAEAQGIENQAVQQGLMDPSDL